MIDAKNEIGQNCLQKAIQLHHTDVIKVLLNDKNWLKLFQSYDEKNNNNLIYSMADKKMWDMIKIILDNCHLNRNEKSINEFNAIFDFQVLDPPNLDNMDIHPLMIIANSGQEFLLAHDTIKTLLKLKWNKLPRFIYTFNILIHLVFLILVSVYSLNISDPSHSSSSSSFNIFLMIIMYFITFIFVMKLILFGLISLFIDIESWLELCFLILTMISLYSNDLDLKTNCCTFILLSVYFHFVFLIQKVEYIGMYVLGFKATIKSCAKFFPIFFIIFSAFIISFKTRESVSNLSYFNGTSLTGSFILGFTLMLNNFNIKNMGTETSFINYILYLIFMILLTIITLNLFVGIAVGQISKLLKMAVVQQTSIKIMFVLQVQNSIKFKFLKNLLNMSFSYYSYENDKSKLFKLIDKFSYLIRIKLKKYSPSINLIDPMKHLDEKIDNLSRQIEHENKKVFNDLMNQLNTIESKIAISQKRLIDSVKEAKNNSSAKSNQNENENNNFEIQKINKQISMIQSKIDNLSKYTKFNNNKSNSKWKI